MLYRGRLRRRAYVVGNRAAVLGYQRYARVGGNLRGRRRHPQPGRDRGPVIVVNNLYEAATQVNAIAMLTEWYEFNV